MDQGTQVCFISKICSHTYVLFLHNSYSTEVYFTYDQSYVDAQLDWLIKDLSDANKIENRKERPWIIAFGHRPMYCSNIDDDDCTKPRPILRAG